MFDEIFLFDNSLCMDFVFLLISMMIEDSVVIEDFILSLEDLFSIDYLQDIYFNIFVNIFDVIFLDVLVEKFICFKIWFGNMFGFGFVLLLKEGSDVLMDFEGIFFVYFDLEGVEEFSDIVFWFCYFLRRIMSDVEIVNYEDVFVFEGLFFFIGFGFLLLKFFGFIKEGLCFFVDSWVDYNLLGQGYVQFVVVLDIYIWCIIIYENIFYCFIYYFVVNWIQFVGLVKMIVVNNIGDVIWSIDCKNYVYV